MLYGQFFDSLLSGAPILGDETTFAKYQPYINKIAAGEMLSGLEPLPALAASVFDTQNSMSGQQSQRSVAVIPLSGGLTRMGSWWDYGTEDVAALIDDTVKETAPAAIILSISSPGGSTDCMPPMVDAIQRAKKAGIPVFAHVAPMAGSAAYYIASYCTAIYAEHRMSQIGSIGAMSILINTSEAEKQWGYKRILVNSDLSPDKNKTVMDALKGKTEALRNEVLNPIAEDFQQVVRANRKKADESALTGKMYFADDAIALGLCDGIKNRDEMVGYALQYSDRKAINNLLTK